MKTINLKSKRLLRIFFFCISFAMVAFVFQGCYPLGDDGYLNIKVTGTVKSKTTNLPIEGIKIAVGNGYQYKLTDENGNFDFYAEYLHPKYSGYNSIKINFVDIDSSENGYFVDTTIIVNPLHIGEVVVFMKMEEKQ